MTALAIKGVGAVSPVGGDAAATVGSIFSEAQVIEAPAEARVQMPVGVATPVPATVKGLDRLVTLGGFALRESTSGLAQGIEIGMVVCAPDTEDEPDLKAGPSLFLSRLAAEANIAVAVKSSRVLGADGIIEALRCARTMLQTRSLSAVCVLGVDSMVGRSHQPKVLREASAEDLVPGEAAAAILLDRGPGPDSLADLAGCGGAEELSLAARPTKPNLGEGITSAINQATADAGLTNGLFAALVHDCPPSQPSLAELAWAKARLSLRTVPDVHVVVPWFSSGQTGAASGALSLVTLAYLLGKGAFAHPGLCLFVSKGTHRGAAILTPPHKIEAGT